MVDRPFQVIACEYPSSRGVVPEEVVRELARRIAAPGVNPFAVQQWLLTEFAELGVEVYEWMPQDGKRPSAAWRFPQPTDG
jgi:hypothetical protein